MTNEGVAWDCAKMRQNVDSFRYKELQWGIQQGLKHHFRLSDFQLQ